ncbi:hypothetical protein DFH07DRAFT_937710 [Mycena maculata]|uniref:3'-5' exonuclease domain-containing protein n=1 Tax=Mycena maculata TaxID=230809 RepID=A0AAD7JYH1_9AGAR|nr:hypothetical protein DFH07DRAFT_937710 [Mycena maculata]
MNTQAAVPQPKATHGGRRAGSGRKKKDAILGSSTHTPKKLRHTLPARTLGLPLCAAPQSITTRTPAPFFAPRNTNQPVASGSSQTGRATFYSILGTSRSGLARENTTNQDGSSGSSVTDPSNQPDVSVAEFSQITEQLEYIDENDEHADIASGDRVINDSLINDVLDTTETNVATAEAETRSSEAKKDSVLQKQFTSLRDRLSTEIKQYGSPLCYRRGDFYDRAPHPVFALHRGTGSQGGLDPTELYARDVFIWIPNLLPGAPNRFKCTCGKPLGRHGWNDDPIARRVRSIPADFFLLTNRFICNPRRAEPGCGTTFQGTDPHIIAQLPSFVQPAFPAYISARGAISKLMMWQMCNTFATRFGPSPFSEMVSEIQHRHHADGELIYLAAVNFYGQRGCEQFSKFDDPQGYAGSPPSVPYLKALFTDFIAAHRIYIERDLGSLPLTVAKADHTFDFLKYMGGLKGERIFSAAYTVVNEFEEVRAHALTQTKSLAVVEDMFEGIQDGLKNSKNPPTQILYTDSPQGKWSEILTTTASDSVDIEEAASEVLGDFINISSSSSPLQAVALAIKTEQRLGESPCLHIIQLRTKTKIYIFKVTNLTSRSDVLPSLRAILTNPSIIKIGYSIRQTLQTISQVFSLNEVVDLLKARNPPILDLGKYAKLKGVVEDPSVSLPALAGSEFLRSEIDCQWQIYLSLRSRDSLGLPLQPVQATTHGQLVTLVQGCKPVAEGSIVAQHNGYLEAVMDAEAHTKRINISPSRSLIQISKVLVPGALHSLHGQTMEWIFNHGAHAVVTTSQLHTRGETAPIPTDTMARVFSVPAPAPCLDDTEFSITYESSPAQSANPVEFEHWSESMLSDDSGDESDDESESGDDRYGRLIFEVDSSPDAMQGIEMDEFGSSSEDHVRANFAARQEFVDLLNADDNYTNVLPAIQFTPVPDGELDLSNTVLDEPTSFDSMAGRPADGDSGFVEWEPEVDPTHFNHDIPEIPLTPPPVPPSRQIERQTRLPGASEPAPTKSRNGKRGGQNLCKCGHPPLAKGERVRISEEVIIAYWMERATHVARSPNSDPGEQVLLHMVRPKHSGDLQAQGIHSLHCREPSRWAAGSAGIVGVKSRQGFQLAGARKQVSTEMEQNTRFLQAPGFERPEIFARSPSVGQLGEEEEEEDGTRRKQVDPPLSRGDLAARERHINILKMIG